MANSLIDAIKGYVKDAVSGSLPDLNTLSKQPELLAKQMENPQNFQPPQGAMTPAGKQDLNLLEMIKPDYWSKTYKWLNLQSQSSKTIQQPKKQKTTPTAKKPLTAETIEQTAGSQSSIPILPYTPQGIVELVKQGKLNPAQAQQMLQATAMEELSIEKWLAQIINNINKLPDEIKAEMEKEEAKMNKVYNDLKNNLKEQVKIHKEYADKQIKEIRQHLNWIRQVFTDLIKEKPNLEPDKWTQFGRQLAMALGAISALAHPGYAPYFYMAIPQVVQYWQNEDMYNFEKAMKKFELALKVAGTQLDFYNQIMEHSLTILDKQKEKELLPLTIAGQLIAEEYHAHVDAYNKLKAEYAKSFSDRIAHQLSAIKAGIMFQHYKDWKEIQQFAKQIELERLRETQRHNRVMEGIRNLMAKITSERLNFEKLKQFYPWLFPDKLVKSLGIKDNPQLAYNIFMLYALHGPEKAFAMLPQILSQYSSEPTSSEQKSAKKRIFEDIIPLGEGEEDYPIWW